MRKLNDVTYANSYMKYPAWTSECDASYGFKIEVDWAAVFSNIMNWAISSFIDIPFQVYSTNTQLH